MTHPTAPVTHAGGTAPNSIANEVDEVVDNSPWVEALARLGWGGKGVVYILMGFTALTIARGEQTDDDASPEGALGQVMQNTAGRVLLGVLAVGLVLYVAWRLLTAVLVRGNEAKDWLHRIAYVGSAAFYALLAWTAAVSVLRNVSPEDPNTVERLSRSLLESTVGRWALGALGLVIIVVGIYFIAKKSIGKSFLEELSLGDASEAERQAVTTSGVVGWFGRGVVTLLVGVFVMKAAIEANTEEARGFDSSLREVATSGLGTVAVATAAVGLIMYGIFCLVSLRHQELEDHS